MTDEQLTERARRGDTDAFAVLVERHTAGLYRFIRIRTVDDATAADLVQETFLRALRAIGAFRGEAAFRTWLCRIAQRLIVDEYRRRKRDPTPGNIQDATAWGDPAPAQPGERLEAEAERQDVREALLALPEADRELLRLLYQDGLSYNEIAALHDIPLGTVKVRLHRARVRLRAILEERWGERR